MAARELNLDGLPGPAHHFAGLASGNLASMRHRHEVSNPRRAAHQALDKMRLLSDLGLPQAVMPPHERPDMAALRRLGFGGDDASVLAAAQRDAPQLFHACCSSSAMWTANAATVSPAADTPDGRVHFTPANLVSHLHRAIETPFTAELLRRLFPSDAHFVHHEPLPASATLRDEGAANHSRLCDHHGAPGVEVFVWGESATPRSPRPSVFAGRQTQEASCAVARLHGLDHGRTIFLQQNPAAIDAGVFHNDVIAVANQRVLLHHEAAFADGRQAIEQIRAAFPHLIAIEIAEAELPLRDAVETYLFNSQLVTLPDGASALIAPDQCRDHPRANACIERILAEDTGVAGVHFVSLDQSMRNGGGPACLRLRVVLEDGALAAMLGGARFDRTLEQGLRDWVNHHYRDELRPDELADPTLLAEARVALDELTQILQLGDLYPFQK